MTTASPSAGRPASAGPAPAASADAADALTALLDDVLRAGSIRSVFQPIVDLDTGAVVAYEALARGPQGPLATPDALFGTARAAGRLAELDVACQVAAVRAAGDLGLFDPLTVFVNVEPSVLLTASMDELAAVAAAAAGPVRLVVEITERALAQTPAELLAAVERVRALGWGIAVDDLGAESLSLAFLPLLRPDVIKLDLRLVQERPDAAIAEIMTAVAAHAEHTGALVLAEGIETPEHVEIAKALGAQLGQGWLFGRPTDAPAAVVPQQPLPLLAAPVVPESPFACLPRGTALRTSPKALLVEVSKHLERQARSVGRACVVVATFQEARHLTPATVRRYTALAGEAGFVAALGHGMSAAPAPTVLGGDLAVDDVVAGEWDIAVIGPHYAAALLARDLGDAVADAERRFEYAITHDRDAVVAAAASLLARLRPAATARTAGPAGPVRVASSQDRRRPATR